MIYYFKHVNDFDVFVQAVNEQDAWDRLENYEDELNSPSGFDRTEWSLYELEGNECVGEKP